MFWGTKFVRHTTFEFILVNPLTPKFVTPGCVSLSRSNNLFVTGPMKRALNAGVIKINLSTYIVL